MRPTYLTINTSLVRENLRKIKDSLPEWSTSTAVIKANGYGHGSVMMGRIAVEEGYESLAVAIPEESVYFQIFVGLNAFDKLNGILRLDTDAMHACINGNSNANNHVVIIGYFIE